MVQVMSQRRYPNNNSKIKRTRDEEMQSNT